MDKPETPEGVIKNGQIRDTWRGNQEWTNQRHLKGQSRMDKPETPEGVIKNGQTRDTWRSNQEWTNQRHLKGQSRMNKPETLEIVGIQDKDKQNVKTQHRKLKRWATGPHQKRRVNPCEPTKDEQFLLLIRHLSIDWLLLNVQQAVFQLYSGWEQIQQYIKTI